jgi:secreted trypsin-like serine protease
MRFRRALVSSLLIVALSACNTLLLADTGRSARGVLFEDVDGDATLDAAERGLSAWTVYADLDQNGALDLDEPATRTDALGMFEIKNLPAGRLSLRHTPRYGYAAMGAHGGTNLPLESQVVGGHAVTGGAYPFMSAVSRSDEPDMARALLCGATLLAPDWVLTAAHCTYEGEIPILPAALDVVLGGSNLASGGTERIGVAEIVRHPQYDPVGNDYDIALLRLTRDSLQPTVELLPAALGAWLTPGRQATIIGWGAQLEGAPFEVPLELREARVPIYDQRRCMQDNAASGVITDRMVCAGYAGGGVDACQGDSGGPMLVDGGRGWSWQAGITSFGQGCARPNRPGVYARLSALEGFVKHTVSLGNTSAFTLDSAQKRVSDLGFSVRRLR